MLKIGRLNLDVPFFQAPLSGYSDYAMRKLALENGVPLVFAGVMLAKSVIHPKLLRKPIFLPQDDEHPIGAQILGNDPALMADAARKLSDVGYDLIDLNFACPAPKVLRRKRGGYLLCEPDKAVEIFRKVRDSVNCPVTVKLRTCYRKTETSRDNFRRICLALAEEGVDAIVIHGRSVLQKYKGAADWDAIAEVKRQLPETKIIGSGDLFQAQRIHQLTKETGIDGVSIARGAIGNPWIYQQLRAVFEGKESPAPPTLADQGRVILKHLELICGLYEKNKAVRYLRKFLVNYCKHHPQRKNVQKTLLASDNKKQLLAAIKHWYK